MKKYVGGLRVETTLLSMWPAMCEFLQSAAIYQEILNNFLDSLEM